MKRQSQQGIALVITLILLSVITFMAVTFLVVSRHESESVDTTTQQNVAKFAAQAIEQQAEGQIMASMLGQRNGYNFGLLVSTNYVSPYYDTGGVLDALTNVNYTDANGNPIPGGNLQQMLNNLQYLPRAPVFVSTNKNQLNPEFRFYLDENGNGRFETNGLITNLNNLGIAMLDLSNNPITSIQVGDPEWIGFLERPDQRHSASNFFLSRGAFIAIPIGNTLDINYIHNQAKLPVNMNLDGFLRNQGVGSWEINLAAFLHTLNVNWDSNGPPSPNPYAYFTNSTAQSQGYSFNDAASILNYRYNGGYNRLSAFQAMYPLHGQVSPGFLFGNYYIDGYAGGPLMTNIAPLTGILTQPIDKPWSGADNPVQFVKPRDFLTAVPGLNNLNPLDSFTNRLYSVGTNLDTYDRYTFYRLLAQMGMGSAPEPAPYPASRKINLNYANLGGTNGTNFLPWTPVQFFTNAANMLLRSYYPNNFTILINGSPVQTNININFIPIYPTNYYTPAVHRLLQLAANIYDASTNKSGSAAPNDFDYPSVFRPYFAKSGSGANTLVSINGYTEQLAPGISEMSFWSAPLDLRRPNDLNLLQATDTNHNIYGVPYVVGVRPGLPNFNQFSMAPVVQVTRTMQMTRTGTTLFTNLAYTIGVSNVMAVQCWNSYTSNYNRLASGGIKVLVTNDFSLLLTNSLNGQVIYTNLVFGISPQTPYQINPWPAGLTNGNYVTASFALPLATNSITLPDSPMSQAGFYNTGGAPIFTPLASNAFTHSYFPDWGLTMTNRVRVIIQDAGTGRILDYVQLGGLGQTAGLDSHDDVITNMAAINFPSALNNLWDPTPVSVVNPLPRGLFSQYQISLGTVQVAPVYWATAPSGVVPSQNNINLGIQGFITWLSGNSQVPQQLPFVPTTKYAKVYTWSANDPLVHYMVGDLTDLTAAQVATNGVEQLLFNSKSNTVSGILFPQGPISPRYRPWNNLQGVKAPMNKITTANHYEYADPQITQTADYQFLTNKFPNVGWLGRVHRGTPWQTVYLKSHAASFDTNAWQNWTGNPNPLDAAASQPTNDWQLLDLFTTAPNDNASRGQLSVNQTNAAAWAAVLDGVLVLSNSPTGLVTSTIDTTTNNGPGQLIISSIYTQRTNFPGGVFSSMGQVLSTPQLTVASPYLNTANPNDPNLTDAVYERIPQQIASLLRLGSPRYAIYAYGQALKAADRSIVQSGQFFGMPTNYQITGEVLTRTIVRFDNAPTINNLGTPGVSPKAVVESFMILGPDQ